MIGRLMNGCIHTTKAAFAVLVLLIGGSFVVADADRTPPNIIYLMLDEWGYFESGHMGHPELLTPNIDRFADEARFRCGGTNGGFVTLDKGAMLADGGSPIIRSLYC